MGAGFTGTTGIGGGFTGTTGIGGGFTSTTGVGAGFTGTTGIGGGFTSATGSGVGGASGSSGPTTTGSGLTTSSAGSSGSSSGSIGNAPAAVWAKTLGPDLQIAGSRAAGIDSNGNVILGGDFQDHLDLGDSNQLTNSGAFLAKYDDSGNLVWGKAFGGLNSTSSTKLIAVDGSGNIYVAGRFTTTVDLGGGALTSARSAIDAIFIGELDPSGHEIWSKSFGDGVSSAELGSMTLDGQGGIVLSGTFDNALDFGGGALVATGASASSGSTSSGSTVDAGAGDGGAPATKSGDFLVKLDAATGNHVWSKALPPTVGAYSALDASRNIYFTGAFSDPSDFGGGTLTSVGGYDLVVAKFDPAGEHTWSKSFGTQGDDIMNALAVSTAGNPVLSGMATDAINFGGGALPAASTFLVSFDGQGALKWSKAFGGAVQIGSIGADGAGGLILAGSAEDDVTYGPEDIPAAGGGSDLLMVKIDPSGNWVWGIRDGTGSGASIAQIAVNTSKGTAIAGTSRTGTLNLGTGPLACNGMCAMVAKLAP